MKRFFIVSSTNTVSPAAPNLMADAVCEQTRIRRERQAAKAAVTATTLPGAPCPDVGATPLLSTRVKAKWPTTLPLLKAMAAQHLPLPAPIREVPFLRLMSLHETHDAFGHGFVTLRFQRMGNVPATRSVTLRLRELLALLEGKEARNVRH